jgi:hypothetical protein
MRLIYVDEAGISPKEPIAVVIGIIVHPDTQYMLVRNHIYSMIREMVPAKFLGGFVFHASDIWGLHKYRQDWSTESRIALLEAMMGIPQRFGLSIAWSFVRKEQVKGIVKIVLEPNQQLHLQAFTHCLDAADEHMRMRAWPTELASVVAEDNTEMRRAIRAYTDLIKHEPQSGRRVHRNLTDSAGNEVIVEALENLRLTRIIDTTHFVLKHEAPLVQVADACAFGFRRFLLDKKDGEQFAAAILGANGLDYLRHLRASTLAINSGVIPIVPQHLIAPGTESTYQGIPKDLGIQSPLA